MNVWFIRVVACAFLISLIVSPQSANMATGQEIPAGTPIVGDSISNGEGEVATQGATVTPDEADPAVTGVVSGLPGTGQGNNAGVNLLLTVVVVSLLAVTAVGIRLRTPRA